MCGIAGLVHYDRSPVDPAAVRRMCDTMAHRGPDDAGVEQPAPWVALGHRRLSIIDLEGGHQPLANEHGTVWVTFNGEIFNYLELRAELESKGHRFATHSDTEVLVHLWEEEGPRCVERLNGQFAFAIFEGERLFLARDPIGIKPLLYWRSGTKLAFASEMRALLALGDVAGEPDAVGVRLFLSYRFIPSPLSAVRDVRKLRAGEWLLFDAEGHERSGRHWALDPERVEDLHDADEARDLLRRAAEEAVERQMIADVPVGAFLSGGIDSSTIVALMAEHASTPVRTFAMGFEDAGADERSYAAEVASFVGTDHTEELFDEQDRSTTIETVLDQIDEPFGDRSLLPTYAVARLARRQVKTVLSGDGGDELFAGYGRYFRAMHLLAIPRPSDPRGSCSAACAGYPAIRPRGGTATRRKSTSSTTASCGGPTAASSRPSAGPRSATRRSSRPTTRSARS